MMEKYSVLMSVYYKEKPEFLKQAIDSMLNQTIKPDDFVLVCDGPLNEGLDRVVAYFEQKYPQVFNVIRLKNNQGLGNALNVGLNECKNELVARMDSDDISVSNRLELQLEAFESHPNASVIGGQIAEFCGNTDNIVAYRKVPLDLQSIKKMLVFRNPINHVTTLIKKTDILDVGSYENYLGYEDYQLWVKLIAEDKQLENINEVLCYVRTDDNMFRRRGGMNYFRNTKRFFDFMKEKNDISDIQYIKNIMLRFFGSVLITPKFREFLYGRFLREKNKG